MKIMVLGSDHYVRWFNREFDSIPGKVEFVKNADLVVFTGGADVDPRIYGHKKSKETVSSYHRDAFELLMYVEARTLNKPMLGICRGAQFLTACQPGGALVQDAKNHGVMNGHAIEFLDGSKYTISSTHHQMMYPFEVENYELLAWASPRLAPFYEYNGDTIPALPGNLEPEIVFYPDSKALAIQGHPEMMETGSRILVKLKELISEKLSL